MIYKDLINDSEILQSGFILTKLKEKYNCDYLLDFDTKILDYNLYVNYIKFEKINNLTINLIDSSINFIDYYTDLFYNLYNNYFTKKYNNFKNEYTGEETIQDINSEISNTNKNKISAYNTTNLLQNSQNDQNSTNISSITTKNKKDIFYIDTQLNKYNEFFINLFRTIQKLIIKGV